MTTEHIGHEVLIVALEEAGWRQVGRRSGVYVRLAGPAQSTTTSLLVPVNPEMEDYQDSLDDVLGRLVHSVTEGQRAQRVLDYAQAHATDWTEAAAQPEGGTRP